MTATIAYVPHEPLTAAGADLRASRARSRLYDAYCFFRSVNGAVGRRAAVAWDLARAEQWARRQRSAGLLRIGWENDPEPWEECSCGECAPPERVECCYVQMRRPESVDGRDRCIFCGLDSADRCSCPCKDGGWTTVASLCGIADADDDYRRLVEAELCSEAMGAV